MDPNPTEEELRVALRNERAEREAAQRKAAKQAENASVWRTRAEDRAARIDRLEAERDQLRSVSGFLRAKAGAGASRVKRQQEPPRPPTGVVSASPRSSAHRAFLSTTVATVGIEDNVVDAMLAQFNCVSFLDDPGIVDRADIVIWDPANSGSLPESGRDRLQQWSSSHAGVAPLVLLSDPAAGALSSGRTQVRADRQWRRSFETSPSAPDWVIPTTFDASAFNPSTGVGKGAIEEVGGDPQLIADGGDDGIVVRAQRDLSVPWMVAASAAAIPFDPDESMSRDQQFRDGVAGRRSVFRDRAPWHAASELLDCVSLSHRSPLPSVAGVLMSNRPDSLPGAIRALQHQTYPNFELVIGCHGFGTADALAVLDDLSKPLTARVLAFDPADSLGTCLNRAIDTSDAQVLAKIDDDDHYGPGYIEDAVQAMLYSGANLVAKGAVFTYIESRDETILRRPKTAERFYSGSPNGASMVFTRDLWQQVGFPDRTLGEDVSFGAAAEALGVRPYATSPWEFVYRRSLTNNTWQAVDEVFLEGSVPAWPGDRPAKAEIAAP